MARPYRARNKRIIHRTGGGRFRKSTLADVGLGCCERCGAIFSPNLDDLTAQTFIDPAAFNERRRICGPCLGLPEPPPSPPRRTLMQMLDEAMGRPDPEIEP